MAKAPGQHVPTVACLATNSPALKGQKASTWKIIPEVVQKEVAWQFFQSNRYSLNPYRLNS